MRPKIKIFDTCWHIPHQWDMINALRDDCDFFFGLNLKRRHWDTTVRPIPSNLSFVPHYEKGKYDIAILHIDQSAAIESTRKRIIYDEFNAAITDIPKIVINHGTPVIPEAILQSPETYGCSNANEMQAKCVETVKKLLDGNWMVVNSHAAAGIDEWGFGKPIVHGIPPDIWHDLPKEPRVFTALSAAGFDEYYNRKCMDQIREILHKKYSYTLYHAKVNVKNLTSFDTYRRFLGKSLLYLDTSFRTPMNRARTEAFLSGCCVIQVEGAHDLERWAKPEENIILVKNDPMKISELIVDLLENRYAEAVSIGQSGKQMAIREFSPERYRSEWLALLHEILLKSQL